MRTVIHINQHVIKANKKNGTRYPAITVKNWKITRYGFTATINGPFEVVYRPLKPLACGAHCWIETSSEVEVS